MLHTLEVVMHFDELAYPSRWPPPASVVPVLPIGSCLRPGTLVWGLCDDAGVPGDVAAMEDRRRPRRVVVTFPLQPSAWDHLAGMLGDRVELVDVRAADGQEDVVLVPSTSRQLIGKISATFPRAVVMVVEIEDSDHGVELGGQVLRSLDAGAGGYYVARSLDQLAGVVDHALAPQQASTPQPTELPSPHEDELWSILDRLVRPEPATERTEPPPT